MLRRTLLAVSMLVTACSSSEGASDDAASALEAAEEELTLENVFLGHADPRTYEPGEPRYHFPVAAKIFYGFFKLRGYEIELPRACTKFEVERTEGPPASYLPSAARAKFTVSCIAPDGERSIIAESAHNFVESDGPLVLGSSLTFTDPSARLVKTGPKHYRLELGRASAQR